jgi:hypothetical protein
MAGDRPPTNPTGAPPDNLFWHINQRVEDVHEEAKAFRSRQLDFNAATEKQLLGHDLLLTQHKDSLNAGNARFASIEAKILPRWSAVLGVLMALGGAIWVAARYPDEQKFERLQGEVQLLREKQIDTGRDIKEIRAGVERLEQLENKIDAVLIRTAAPPPQP